MENRVFIIGDSQTKYLHQYFSTLMNYRVTLNAASGRRIQDVPPSLLSECGKYSHIILHLGTNNVSGEDPDRLLMEVQCRPSLYDISHKDYHNVEKNNNLWEEVARAMNSTDFDNGVLTSLIFMNEKCKQLKRPLLTI